MNLSKIPTSQLKEELQKRLEKEGNELYIMKPLFPDPREEYTQKGGGGIALLFLIGLACFCFAVSYLINL